MAGRMLILMYHRVALLPADPQLLAVAPQRFGEHLEVLVSSGLRPTRLSELARAESWPEEDGVVITFDDGYADNCLNARELLIRHNMPATFMVTTDILDGGREFWWDELEGLLLAGATSEEGSGAWDVLQEPLSDRQRAYLEQCQRIRPLSKPEREREMQLLRAANGCGPLCRESFRGLTTEELTRLELPGLLDIGGHTLSHSQLSQLSAAEQREEILGGALRLSQLLGHPIETFSYPYGTSGDFTSETAEIVREAGFSLACANYPDFACVGTDSMALPRCIVRNWDRSAFAGQLERWRAGQFQ